MRVRAASRRLGWVLLALWLLFVSLVLVLRHGVLPRIADYRPAIEAAASRAIGLPVKIESISAGWRGLNPDLVLDAVSLLGPDGEPALRLQRVEAVLSWQSLWRLQPMLAELQLAQPVLQVRRDPDGQIRIAGLRAEGESDPALAEWLLALPRIRIRDATVVWEDRHRGAPPLVLEDLQFGLDNSGRRHRFGLQAAPPAQLAAQIDLRGEFLGQVGEAIEQLAGQVYLQLDYADLAGWQPWVDYPVHLPRGRGALRLWGELGQGQGQLTADLALAAVDLQLGRKLPALAFDHLQGRLQGRYRAGGWALSGRQLTLATRDGLVLAPTDFHVDWQSTARGGEGKASASTLDLAALARLADHLPLDAQSRQLLRTHQPQGGVSSLRTSWQLEGEQLSRYALSAQFANLGVQAAGYFPGARGLSGGVDFTERGGQLTLAARDAGLALPAVFPSPDLAFAQLDGQLRWQVDAGAVEVIVDQLVFAGADATGTAQGRYRYAGEGPGDIDLEARVSQADGTAVWRYMPHGVNASVRDWLRQGIVAGTAHDGHLLLKGDLRHFPFRDPSTGTFRITARAQGAKIDYARGWPVIEGIDGQMVFGVGMQISGARGQLLGASLHEVSVQIPDFDSGDEQLQVHGLARGPTAEFLRFIEQSPVAAAIDHFTDGMQAKGHGQLDLRLDIPLHRPARSRVRGRYHFDNNTLQVVDGLPALTQVSGALDMTEQSVTASGLRGRVFGGPLKVQVGSVVGRVSIQASGQAQMRELSQHFGWPLIDHLSGGAAWQADIGIRGRQAEIRIASDLLGVSSPLPAPLNKVATVALPLRIDGSVGTQDARYRITLGDLGQGVIVGQQGRWLRGVLAVGLPLQLPESGLAVRLQAARFDADAWKNYLPDDAISNGDGLGLSLSQLVLKTPQLHLFGRDYHQVDLSLQPRDAGWRIRLDTREAAGELFWRGSGDGWLDGRLQRLHLRRSAEVSDEATQVIEQLPGMNLVVDDFRLGDMALGRLDLKARNAQGVWHLEQLALRNADGRLEGRGTWRQRGGHRTQLEFDLVSNNVGRLLDRLGYADSVRRGSAHLAGNMQWSGPLTAIDYASLSGRLQVSAERGQFNKLEPGVGKLLGLISLQALPRRLTLDFRDVFSDGLAFDRIEGLLKVDRGVMRTEQPLSIKGPAAQVEMSGEADLQRETQDLQVLVRPELGGLAAVGTAALVNPIAGAAALLANTVLQQPLNQWFSYRYHVTGTWDDPRIVKLGTPPAEKAP